MAFIFYHFLPVKPNVCRFLTAETQLWNTLPEGMTSATSLTNFYQ